MRRLIELTIGCLIGLMIWHWLRPEPEPQPLKVTILNDGGADLKVESTVKK